MTVLLLFRVPLLRILGVMVDRTAPVPTEIKLHQKSRVMELTFSDGERFELPYELLRVYSPSAEVRAVGHRQSRLAPAAASRARYSCISRSRFAPRS